MDVPVVILSAENDNKLLKQLKTGLKELLHGINIDQKYLIRLNRLFALSFENEVDRTSFEKYYVPKLEVQDFNVLIDGKQFFEIPIKNKEEAYEAIIEMRKNNQYTTDSLLDY